MELTSKQRAQLRGLANSLDTILHVGKDGMEARELIKGRVLENSMLTAREACEQLAKLTRSESVQVIGSKFVLYRRHYDKSRRRIELVKDRPPRQGKQ